MDDTEFRRKPNPNDGNLLPVQGQSTDLDGWKIVPGEPSTKAPEWLLRLAYRDYAARYGTSQSFERLHERGGFGRLELLAHLAPACIEASKLYRQEIKPFKKIQPK